MILSVAAAANCWACAETKNRNMFSIIATLRESANVPDTVGVTVAGRGREGVP